MRRIIINEVDNTSNVEQLSSYDVVYVPGFSVTPADPKYFRNPTLVTSKYQFKKMFGELVPTFDSDQPYPIASSTTDGFPSYAIPNFSDLVVDDVGTNLSTFSNIVDDPFTTYYSKVDVVAGPEDADWIPNDQVNYFLVTQGADDDYTVSYSTLPLPVDPETGEQATYVETYGAEGSNNVYQSAISPLELNWYENYGTSESPIYRLTGDTQIGYVTPSGGGDPVIKTYYTASRSTPPMFSAGDADPGYRYALYLLTLGIPVYYEMMNSGGNWTELDLVSDFQSNLIRYGTSEEVAIDEGETPRKYISPYIQGWWYYDGATYKKADDPTIKYYTVEDVPTSPWYIGADISIDSLYSGLSKRFMTDPGTPDYSFDSIGDYSVKYVTAGGYPVFEYGRVQESSSEASEASSGLAYAMMDLCWTRGDALALLDHTDNPERSIYEGEELSVITKVREYMENVDDKVASHGAMFTPWYSCTHAVITGEGVNQWSPFMPASLAYLSALSTQLKNYNPWLAVSGVTRGKIPYFGSLHTNYTLTNNVADSYQSVPSDEISEYALVSINPITYIRQYGYCIWGNRTLRNNKLGTKASSFLNVRNVVSDIKKRLYETSQQLLFEQNTDILWLNFKGLVTPLLDNMVSNYILSDYKLTKYNIDPESGDPVPAYMVLANLKIMPINSVEVFDLTIQLENNEISVAEEQ